MKKLSINQTDLVACSPSSIFGSDFHRAKTVDGNQQYGELRDQANSVVDREPEVAKNRA